MKRALAWSACAAALAIGCGSTVAAPGQSAGTTSGSGGATTTTTTTPGTGGTGGSIDFTTSTTTSAGTGGGPACNDATVFVDIEGDVPLQHLDASCLPIGVIDFGGGPNPPPPPDPPSPPAAGLMFIDGCSAQKEHVLTLASDWMTFPGSSSVVRIWFWYGGEEYHESPVQSGFLEVTKLEPTGGVIEGTFSGTLAPFTQGNGPPVLKITGKFRVCHGMDFATI